MNTKIKIVFLDTRTKIREEAMPHRLWVDLIVGLLMVVSTALFALGIGPIWGIVPWLAAGFALAIRYNINRQ